jgi:hypothetical protein
MKEGVWEVWEERAIGGLQKTNHTWIQQCRSNHPVSQQCQSSLSTQITIWRYFATLGNIMNFKRDYLLIP